MKNWRLIAISIMLIVVLGLFGFGVYAIFKGNDGVLNNTGFVSGDENVFVNINGTYSGPHLENDKQAIYSFNITRDMQIANSEHPINVPSWDLGTTNFTRQENKISILFMFTNTNEERSLAATLSNIAVDNDEKFLTQIRSAKTKTDLETTNPVVIDYENNNIGKPVTFNMLKSETIFIEVLFTIQTFNQPFSFINNMIVTFTTY